MVARIASPAVPDWAPTRVELPGSVSTYLPSLARSTSGVWCPRVGDPRSGSSRHRSSARICRAPWSDRPGRAPTGACPWTGRARLGSGRSDACRDRGGAAADRPAATTPGSTDRGRRRGAVVSRSTADYRPTPIGPGRGHYRAPDDHRCSARRRGQAPGRDVAGLSVGSVRTVKTVNGSRKLISCRQGGF